MRVTDGVSLDEYMGIVDGLLDRNRHLAAEIKRQILLRKGESIPVKMTVHEGD